MLSEAAVLGFEYGYSRDYPEALVLWEAQFGDFANGAQIIIDQFIAAGEAKWGLLSGVVMLLPHGYEGQGPEHSSARIERYLQLAAQDNMQIAQPSTAAQYFHLLRRQALRKWRKPLIVFTPKSHAAPPRRHVPARRLQPRRASSTSFPTTTSQTRAASSSAPARSATTSASSATSATITDVGIIFLDQLYPWPEAELQAALDQHPSAHEIVWVQEEPANMGALSYVMPLLRQHGRRPRRHSRSSAPPAASPATGSAKAHELEEKTLIDLALGSSFQTN